MTALCHYKWRDTYNYYVPYPMPCLCTTDMHIYMYHLSCVFSFIPFKEDLTEQRCLAGCAFSSQMLCFHFFPNNLPQKFSKWMH